MMHAFGLLPKNVHLYGLFLHVLPLFPIFARRHSVVPLELFTQIGRGEAHRLGDGCERSIVLVVEQPLGLF